MNKYQREKAKRLKRLETLGVNYYARKRILRKYDSEKVDSIIDQVKTFKEGGDKMAESKRTAALIVQLALLGIFWEASVFFFKQTPTFIEMIMLLYIMSINFNVKGVKE